MHSMLTLWGPHWHIAITFGAEKLEWCGLPMEKNSYETFSRLDIIPACDRRMDEQANR